MSMPLESYGLSHVIGGRDVPGAEDSDRFGIVDPSTGLTVDFAPNAGREQVDHAVESAHSAHAEWGGLLPRERASLITALADALERNADWLAELESANVGKPILRARAELPTIVDCLRYFAAQARSSHGPGAGEYAPGSMSYVVREPIGTVGLITPWNYPLLEAVWKVGPALAAGNTVVLKPSELTPYTSVALARIAAEILPAGVLNVVLGDGVAGRAIVDHPGIGLVSLTGDTATGKAVAAAAASTLKRVHLELGGKAPILVLSDVDAARVAQELVRPAFANAGQDCTAACRIIAAAEVYDDLVEALAAEAAALCVGDPANEQTQMGPVIAENHRERIDGFVKRASASGGRVATGGRCLDRPGWFYSPTVVADVDQGAEIVQREVFGPVVTVQRASSEEEMLVNANGVAYGLSASVWTDSLDRALHYTRRLEFGTVWVNQHLMTVTEMPFGGFGESGYGKELGHGAVDEYSQFKHVMMRGL